MQTIVDLPEKLLLQVEAAAEATGQSTQGYVAAVLREKLAQTATPTNGIDEPGWLRLAGVWKDHIAELVIVEAAMEDAFEQSEPEMWA